VIAFLVVAAFAGLLGAVSVINIQKMEKADTFMYQEVAVPLAGLRDITQAFLLNRISTRALIGATDPDEREEIADSLQESLAALEAKTAAYVKKMDGAEEKAAFAEFKSSFDAYVPLLKQMIDLSLAGKNDEALAIARGDAGRHANAMLKGLDKMSEVSVKHAKVTAENNAKLARTALVFSLAMSVAAVAVALFIGIFVSGRISNPLQQLQLRFQKVAEGDLTVTVDAHCCDEMGSLAKSFAAMVQQLRDLIAQVNATAGAVTAATRELNGTSTEIAGGAEVAAAQTISVATASEEMAATSHDIAHSCQIAVEGSQRANQAAQSGSDVVRQTVEGMRKIATRVQDTARTVDSLGERSDQIGAIVATIEDIADQTNLLALNAAIEAARAGEMGRGFAVVADEVRALAERTTKATREIGEMIKAIQSETKSAVTAMNEGVR
ncbi:MAG: methyl-accepting chemotaxis protein, partial [Trichlorobacter sp.]|uniref:methyl-accepting chemotaxis protein n=1 Tax=Trichlorobacter sp. TaxID=2911007 RepID=UPI0025683E98